MLNIIASYNKLLYSIKHCEVQKWMWVVGLIGDSSGKSQKPLYSKLENYPETQDKSPNSILRLLPSYTFNKGRLRRAFERKGFFYVVNIVKKPCYYQQIN